MSKPTWIKTEEYLVIVFTGNAPMNVKVDSPLFKQVLQALVVEEDYDKVFEILTPEKVLTVETKGDLNMDNQGVVKNRNKENVDPVVKDYIPEFLKNGWSFEPLARLAENISKARSQFVRDQMVRFLRASKFQITEDGCFIAFKGVLKQSDGNLVDAYSGDFNNNVGEHPTMPYEDVDADPHRTCSHGLHVGAWEYMGSYTGSSHSILAVKVNPADVVSVPYDYQDQKMRTCGYVVVARDLKSPEDYQVEHPLRSSAPQKAAPVEKVIPVVSTKKEAPAPAVEKPVKVVKKPLVINNKANPTGEVKIDLNTLSGSQIISLTWLQCKKRILISPKSKVRVVKYAVEHFQASKLHVSGTTVKVQSSFVQKVKEK
jgi:hypothetical protein